MKQTRNRKSKNNEYLENLALETYEFLDEELEPENDFYVMRMSAGYAQAFGITEACFVAFNSFGGKLEYDVPTIVKDGKEYRAGYFDSSQKERWDLICHDFSVVPQNENWLVGGKVFAYCPLSEVFNDEVVFRALEVG